MERRRRGALYYRRPSAEPVAPWLAAHFLIVRRTRVEEIPMGRPYATENDAERARLKAFVAGLSDATITRSIGHGWTVGVGLAHLAFWDRLWLAKFEEWERTGVVRIPPVETFVSGINDGMLPWWQAIAPAQIRYEVLAAAEA